MNQTPGNNTVAFETRHYVYGQNIDNMSADQLIQAVKQVEREIEDLAGVKTNSAHIDKRIKELKAMLAEIVKVLDTK